MFVVSTAYHDGPVFYNASFQNFTREFAHATIYNTLDDAELKRHKLAQAMRCPIDKFSIQGVTYADGHLENSMERRALVLIDPSSKRQIQDNSNG